VCAFVVINHFVLYSIMTSWHRVVKGERLNFTPQTQMIRITLSHKSIEKILLE